MNWYSQERLTLVIFYSVHPKVALKLEACRGATLAPLLIIVQYLEAPKQGVKPFADTCGVSSFSIHPAAYVARGYLSQSCGMKNLVKYRGNKSRYCHAMPVQVLRLSIQFLPGYPTRTLLLGTPLWRFYITYKHLCRRHYSASTCF